MLESTQESLSKLGITPSQSAEKYPLNVKNVAILFWLICLIICSVTFLVTEAETAKEYINLFNSTLTIAITFIEFALHVWKMRKLFQFIFNLEELIQNSE